MMLWPIIKMVFLLGFLFTAIFISTRLLRRNKITFSPNDCHSFIKLLGSQWIAPQKYISIVDIGGELFALGVSESQITLLTKIEDKELAKKIIDDQEFKASRFLKIPFLFKERNPWAIWLRKTHEKKIKPFS